MNGIKRNEKRRRVNYEVKEGRNKACESVKELMFSLTDNN
jgi:hypothetical protein